MKFQMVIQYIENEINDKRLTSGSKLPSVRIMAEELGCSKSTVQKAYERMKENRLAYVIDKSGYYLMNNPETILISDQINFSKLAINEMFLDQNTFQIIFNKIMLEIESEDQDIEGLFSLRVALKKYFKDRKIFTTVHDLFIYENIQQAYKTIVEAVLSKDQGVLIENPSDSILIDSLKNKHVFTFNRDGHHIDFALLEYHLIKNNIKLLVITTNGHLPTGDIVSLEDRKRLLNLCYDYGVRILELNFIEDALDYHESQSLYALDKEDIVFHLKSYSHIVSEYINLIALITPHDLSKSIKNYKSRNLGYTSLINQVVLRYFIEHVYEESRHIFLERKLKHFKVFDSLLKTIDFPDVFELFHSPDRLYTFIKVPFDYNLETLLKELQNENVIIGNIKPYFYGEHTFKGMMISFLNVNEKHMEKGISLLKKYLQ